MKKVGELFADLAQKAGISIDHKGLKDLLSLTSDVDTEVERAINGLISVDAAKNDKTIKWHYLHQAFDVVNDELLSRAEKLKMGDDIMKVLKTDDMSGHRKIKSFLDKMEEMKAAAVEPKKETDKEAEKLLKSEIEKLNGSLSAMKETHANDIKAKDEFHNNYIKDSKILNVFSSQNWSEHYAPDMRESLTKIALEKELNKMGAKIVSDEKGELKLVQSANPEMEYFDSSNKKVIFTELVPQIMAANKFSVVSDKTDPVTPQNTIVGGGKPPVTPQGNNTVANLLNKSLQDQNQL
jgi:hypothetical protein